MGESHGLGHLPHIDADPLAFMVGEHPRQRVAVKEGSLGQIDLKPESGWVLSWFKWGYLDLLHRIIGRNAICSLQ